MLVCTSFYYFYPHLTNRCEQQPERCKSNEVIVSRGFQLVQEDDAVPPRLYILMNFESEQKWTQLNIDDDGDEEEDMDDMDVVVPPSVVWSSSSVIVNTSGDHNVSVMPTSNNDDNDNNSKDKDILHFSEVYLLYHLFLLRLIANFLYCVF